MKVIPNRVLGAFKTWDDRKKEMEPMLKSGTGDDRILDKLQLDHLRKAGHRMKQTARPDEQPFMVLLNNHIGKLEKQLYPNVLLRLFLRLKDRFVDGPAYLKQHREQRTANMESLKEQLKASGLGSMAGRLENHLDADQKSVSLPMNCQLEKDKRLHFDLHFEKDQFGNFQMTRLDGSLIQNNTVIKSHEFKLNDWPNLKANQIWSLLEGRAMKQQYIDVSGHESHRWVELGTKGVQHYDPKHPFDVKTALAAMPSITRNKDELIRYLENGQQISTHWKQNGQFQSIFVQADPANKNIKLFDAKQKPVTAEQLIQKAALKKPEVPVQKIRKGIKNGQHI